jgi:hypothetical protein
VNPGAAKIERDFVDYFNSAGVATEPTAFDGRSDYKAFQDNGVAAGGLFSGAEVAKSEAQVAKWGGQLGVAFDHCYHQACDDITNLDLAGYDVLADGGAHVLALLAEDPDLRDSLGGGATAAAAAKKSLTAAPLEGPQGQDGRVPRQQARPVSPSHTQRNPRGAAVRPPLVRSGAATEPVLRAELHPGHFSRNGSGPGTADHSSLTRSIPRWRKEAEARGPVRYFKKAATIGRTPRRRRSVTNEIG